MSRVVLILAVWVVLGTLVAGLACLARAGRESRLGPPILRFTQSATSGTDVRVTVLPGSSAPHPAAASARVEPATTIAATTTAAMTTAATTPREVSSTKSVAQDPTPAPPKPAPAPAPAPKKPARPDPTDEGNDGSNGGLGRLPPGVPPEYEGLGVTCVSAATGRPITDVKVRSLTQNELDEWAQRNPGKSVEDEDPEMVLAASSTNVKTSVYGVAIAPSGPGKMLVDAKLGVLYAYAWVDRNKSSQVKLEMVEDRDVVFQTRGPDGAPRAGLPVVVYARSGCLEIWRGTTQGDDATVRMRHAAFLMQSRPDPFDYRARIEGLLFSSRPVDLPRLKLPTETQVLTLPETRSVVVRVKDPEGALVKMPVGVTLGEYGAAACESSSDRVAEGGEARFERVETEAGRRLAVSVSGGDVYPAISLSQFDADQPIVEARFGRRYPVARITLVDGEDKPLAGVRVQAWLDPGEKPPAYQNGERAKLVSGSDGAVRIPLTRTGPEHAQNLLVLVLDDAGDPTSAAIVPLEGSFESGERDLGTVKVALMPVVAQGYVVDEREAAIPGAWVSFVATDDPKIDLGNARSDIRWHAVSDHSGFFKLRSLVEGARIGLQAYVDDHARSGWVPVQRGDKKVKLVLPRCGTLVSKLLLPSGMPSDAVRLSVAAGGRTIPMIPGGNDIHRATGLPPCKASVTVWVRDPGEPITSSGELLFSLDDVEVKPGAEVSDPRVIQIDLKQHMLWIQVHVTDADGSDVAEGAIKVLETGEGGRKWHSVPIRAGFARFATSKPAVDVEVHVPGFVTRTLKDVDTDADVQLVREK